MEKTFTFSFKSTAFEGVEAKETFTYDELGLREGLDSESLQNEIDRIFHAWIWDKLNISYSIVTEL